MFTLSFFNLSAQSRSSYDAAFFKTEEQEAAIEVGKGINITDSFTVTRQCFTSASRDGNLLKKQGTQGATTKIEVFSSNGSSKDFALDAKLKYKADLNFKVSNSSEISNKFRNRGFQVSITVQGPHLETESWEDAILQLRDGEDLIVSVSAYLKNQLKTMQNERDALPVRYFFTDFTMYGCQGIKWNIAKEKKLSSINRNFLECNTIVNMAQENIEKNPIQNPDTYINMAVNLLSQQGSVSYTYDWLVDKAKTLNPQWTSLINSANDLIDKLKKQYDNCSDITCGVNETCCGNIDYTEQVKALFNKYNAIYDKLFNYADEWYAAVEQQEKQCVKKAQFTVVNKSSNPYYIYINGKFDTELAGGYQRTWNANL